ncbi:MAG TPA: type II toxin-antitoxin system HicB family antitoxin [Halococcus sp.]|nr:type II toxin-antitoxin system HicB family antitoxin [Halococcus sp.]
MSESLVPEKFTVIRDGDVWVATHTETGIASQGDDPNEAVAMATEAVELSQGDHEPASAEEQENLRRELGIDGGEDEPEIDSPSGMP